jgi:hypothetical protein
MFTVEEKVLESLGWASGSSFYKALRAATGQQQQQQRAAAAGRSASPAPAGAGQRQQQQEQDGNDMQMQDATDDLPSTEQQQELQQEAAAAAALDLSSAAAAADNMLRRTRQGVKRGSETGSGGDAMDTEVSRGASGSPSILSGSAKRHRGFDGKPSERNSPAVAAVVDEELPLPRAFGTPPSSSGGGAAAVAAGCDPAALLVLHDYCRKVLKLAAFRLVAVR